MDNDIASKVVHSVMSVYAAIGELDATISQVESEAERRQLANAIGEILRITREQVLKPIFSEYPELTPAELRR